MPARSLTPIQANSSIVLDTNVILRFFIRDDQAMFDETKKVMRMIESGSIEAQVSILVIHEVLLVAKRVYAIPLEQTCAYLEELISEPAISISELSKRDTRRVLQIVSVTGVDVTDAYISILSESTDHVCSFDQDIEKVKEYLDAQT